jgi:exodeoxyribonuclease VII small subunit
MTQKTFDQALKQLEQIVEELEKGDMPLEKALKRFEEGIKLSRFCSDRLDETEKKVSLLIQDPDGRTVTQPFISEATDDIAPDDGDGD